MNRPPKSYLKSTTNLMQASFKFLFRKRFCTFYAEEGGFRSSFSDNSPGDELYFLGIIDILTPYSLKKRLEHGIKSIQYDEVP
jgi:hypothetical protein